MAADISASLAKGTPIVAKTVPPQPPSMAAKGRGIRPGEPYPAPGANTLSAMHAREDAQWALKPYAQG